MTTITDVTITPLLNRSRRIAQIHRTRGTARLIYSVLRKLVCLPGVRRCVHFHAVDLWRHPVPAHSETALSNVFQVRLAEPTDRNELAQFFGNRARVEARLARRDYCVIAVSQNSIGAAAWLTPGPNHSTEDWNDLRCVFGVPEGVAWSYDGRGTKLGAWGTLMKQLPSILRAGNIRELVTIIGGNNWKSIDAHRSLGCERLGTLLHARILGVPLHLFKPVGASWQSLPVKIGCVEILKAP